MGTRTLESIIAIVVVLSFIASIGFSTAVFAVRYGDEQDANMMRGFITNNNPNVAANSGGHNLIRTMEVIGHGVLPANGQGSVTAVCPAGWVVTGGGYYGSGSPGIFVYADRPYAALPDTPPDTWLVAAFNTNSNLESISADAICARAP